MRPTIQALLVGFAALAAAGWAGPVSVPDFASAYVPNEAFARLEERANRPVEVPSPWSWPHLGAPAGTQLFFMSGADNASCVRSTPDVTGDGLPEVVVGIDESGVDNVFVVDGASAGAATVVWSIETMDGLSGGSPYGDLSIEPAADADGNGFPNLLVGTAWGGRTAYNLDSLDGRIHWKYDTYLAADSGWVYSLTQLGDVTGDGVPDSAFGVGSDNDRIYLIDGASTGGAQATVRWERPVADATFAVCNLGDTNGDGFDDVVAAVGDNGDALVNLSGGSALPNGQVLWQYPTGGSAFACGVLEDITGDGVNEALAAVWVSDGSAVRCVNGATGAELWTSDDVFDFGMLVDVLKDVTGDGTDEVVVSSWQNAVTVLDGETGDTLWRTFVGTLNGGDVWTARAIDDLNGDGRQDVIAGSFDYHVYAMDGDSGDVLWAYNTGNRVFSVHPVGDLNGDGRPEVAVGTQDTNNSIVFHVLDGADNSTIFSDGFESGDTGAWSSSS